MFAQFMQAGPITDHWLYIALGALATILAAIFASPLLVKIYEGRQRRVGLSRSEDRAIELNRDRELFKIREELRAEVQALRLTRDQILSEKMILTQQIFKLENRIKEQDVFAMEQDEEIKRLNAETEALKMELQGLQKEKQNWLWRHDTETVD